MPPPQSSPENVLQLGRMPCNLLGKILDQGRASAHAAHLLAIKCSKGPGFTLNETHVRKEHRIGERAFRAGIAVLKRSGVMERWQTGAWFAEEELADPSRNFVLFDQQLLKADTNVVAFALVANLSPDPMRPAEVAARFGVKSRMTIRKLVKASIADDFISTDSDEKGAILVARKGYKFSLAKNVVAKNVVAKNVATHRRREKSTGKRKASIIWYAPRRTRPC